MIHKIGENPKDRSGFPKNRQEILLILKIRKGKKNAVIIV
jgi:hypothetical protein